MREKRRSKQGSYVHHRLTGGEVFIFHRDDEGWGNEVVIDKPTIWMADGDSGEVLASFGEGHFR